MDIFTTENLIALVTLTALEIVLGIDNIVFIAIITSRLPEEQQKKARQLGLMLAMGMRVLLLLAINWIKTAVEPIGFLKPILEISPRDLILIAGGLFLIAKATYEIHHKLEDGPQDQKPSASLTFGRAIFQILILDLVFSLDSVITAVGMAQALWVMITAVILAVITMLIFAGSVSRFIERHPTMKMLALSFLLLIGVTLVVDGWGAVHINKGYIYFAMAFSLFVELLNLRARNVAGVKNSA